MRDALGGAGFAEIPCTLLRPCMPGAYTTKRSCRLRVGSRTFCYWITRPLCLMRWKWTGWPDLSACPSSERTAAYSILERYERRRHGLDATKIHTELAMLREKRIEMERGYA